MSIRRHTVRSRPIQLLFAFCAAVLLLPVHAQHNRGGQQGGPGGQGSGGFHGTPGLQGHGTPGLEWHGTPGLQGHGTPGLEWHGTPGLHGGRNFDGGRGPGRQDFHHFDGHDGRAFRGRRFYPAPIYTYPTPIYPYPDPYATPLYAPAPGPVQYWFYCPSFVAYYPDVTECPGGWMQVPAVPDAP